MKIIITGSLGHISKPLTEKLLQQGHDIKVISSKTDKKEEIEALGATAAIGSLEDVGFLSKIFTGADAVYCMIPPNNYFDQNLDLIEYYKRLGNNYANAILHSGVKRIVNLSTIGAHLKAGSGILLGAHNVQNILNELPEDIAITHMRPTSFFYNLYGYLDMIKSHGAIMANYGTDAKIPWVSPFDIADAIADEIVKPLAGRKIRYVASEELTGQETANILGEAIGKPDLKWILATNKETLNGLVAVGMNKQIAAGLVEMYASLQSGLLSEDYFNNRPAIMGKVKLKDFAKEFAAVYHS
jgi:uncharacterized protein YbjT (DUF2867 family)